MTFTAAKRFKILLLNEMGAKSFGGIQTFNSVQKKLLKLLLRAAGRLQLVESLFGGNSSSSNATTVETNFCYHVFSATYNH
jgi:hypothetical protein